MNQLIKDVIQWGIDKNITGPNGKGTIERQFAKFIEELHEFLTAKNDEEKIDALGDMQVVAIQACVMVNGINVQICGNSYGPPGEIHEEAAYAVWMLNDQPDQSFASTRAIASASGFDPDECLQAAYDVISKRTGRMIDGAFVKSSDLPDEDLGELDPAKACKLDGEGCESCQ